MAGLCPVCFNLRKSGEIFSCENTEVLSEADPTTPEPSRNTSSVPRRVYSPEFTFLLSPAAWPEPVCAVLKLASVVMDPSGKIYETPTARLQHDSSSRT
jgi:hypothetical protein